MKYLKTYENVEKTPYYHVGDFYKIPYWKYSHSSINCIFKVVFLLKNDKSEYNNPCDLTMLNLDTFEVSKFNFNESIMRSIINVEDYKKVLRPATEEEIQKFNDNLVQNKFNL